MFIVGDRFRKAGKFDTALKWYLKGAEEGNSDCQFYSAELLFSRFKLLGNLDDLVDANRWYKECDINEKKEAIGSECGFCG